MRAILHLCYVNIWLYICGHMMDRASANVKAERLNHARELLQRFDHLPDAVAQMAPDRGVSPRQAYRYLQHGPSFEATSPPSATPRSLSP